jgi:hypothetical protein
LRGVRRAKPETSVVPAGFVEAPSASTSARAS